MGKVAGKEVEPAIIVDVTPSSPDGMATIKPIGCRNSPTLHRQIAEGLTILADVIEVVSLKAVVRHINVRISITIVIRSRHTTGSGCSNIHNFCKRLASIVSQEKRRIGYSAVPVLVASDDKIDKSIIVEICPARAAAYRCRKVRKRRLCKLPISQIPH